jgi:hypothetical protein
MMAVADQTTIRDTTLTIPIYWIALWSAVAFLVVMLVILLLPDFKRLVGWRKSPEREAKRRIKQANKQLDEVFEEAVQRMIMEVRDER